MLHIDVSKILLAIVAAAFYTPRPAKIGSFRVSPRLAYFLSSDLW
jgi:hypothetical protein